MSNYEATQVASPVIIIVTGAWHVPSHYQKLSSRLRHLGYTVECPQHTTCTKWTAIEDNATVDSDVAQVRSRAEHYLHQGRNVVGVMHSYGGVVGTLAFAGLDRASRKGAAHVQALVYMAAFMPLRGDPFSAHVSSPYIPWVKTEGDRLSVLNPEMVFYHDYSEEDRREAVAALTTWPLSTREYVVPTEWTEEAWKVVAVTYIMFTDDQALLEPHQISIIERAEQSCPGLQVERRKVHASHSGFLSKVQEVTDIIHEICGRSKAAET